MLDLYTPAQPKIGKLHHKCAVHWSSTCAQTHMRQQIAFKVFAAPSLLPRHSSGVQAAAAGAVCKSFGPDWTAPDAQPGQANVDWAGSKHNCIWTDPSTGLPSTYFPATHFPA
jgi:hypothetical protein